MDRSRGPLPDQAISRSRDLNLSIVESAGAATIFLPRPRAGRIAALLQLLFGVALIAMCVFTLSIRGGGDFSSVAWMFGLVGSLISVAALRDIWHRPCARMDAERFELRGGPAWSGRNYTAALPALDRFTTVADRDGGAHVEIVTVDGTSTPLYPRLPSEEHARFVATQLQRQLVRLRRAPRYR